MATIETVRKGIESTLETGSARMQASSAKKKWERKTMTYLFVIFGLGESRKAMRS